MSRAHGGVKLVRMLEITFFTGVPVDRPRAVGSSTVFASLAQLVDAVLDAGVHDPTAPKGAAGYVVAAPMTGPRSNAAAQPTRVVALDYDDAPDGPDWAALNTVRHFAYTTDSHDPDGPNGPRWRVWVELDRAYTAAEVSAAVCPWAGCHLRAISQPVYLPTKVDDIEWSAHPDAPPLKLSVWVAPAAPTTPWTPPAHRQQPSQASTNALVTRWLTRPEGTNRLAGATGAALAEWGWEDDEIRGYVEAWVGAADPKAAKHADDAVRGARRRRAGDRIVGFPTLAAELGVEYAADTPPVEDLAELILAAADASPATTPTGDPDGWTFEYGDVVAEWDPPPVPWLCEALCLAPGAPALVTGYGGSGKTTFVQHLALSVAAGRPVLSTWPVRAGAVTHLDYEQGSDLTKRRYLQLGLGDLPADAARRLRFASFPRQRLAADADTAVALFRAAQGQALLIVDSLVAAADLEDENAADARRPLDTLTRISEATGCVVLVIHHSKKDRSVGRTSARGSSAITDAVSCHITFEKDDEGGVASPATLTLQKVRHILPAAAVLEGAVVTQNGAGRLSLGPSVEEVQNAALDHAETQIVTTLAAGFSGSRKTLYKEIAVSRNIGAEALTRLIQDGTVIEGEKGLILTTARYDRAPA